MKRCERRGWLSVLAVALVLLLVAQADVAAAKKRIAVLPFADGADNRWSEDVCAYATQALTAELVKNRNYEVVERAQLRKVLAEQRLGLTGAVDSSTAARVGQLLGADYVAFGSVDDAAVKRSLYLVVYQQSAVVQLSLRIVDNATGAVLVSERAQGKVSRGGGYLPRSVPVVGGYAYIESIDGAVAEAADEAVLELADKINALHPLVGSVVKVKGKTVYIDLGRNQGVREGDRYEIFREGELVVHPKTGKVLGVEEETLGELEITRVEAEMAVGKANIKAQVGMCVKR